MYSTFDYTSILCVMTVYTVTCHQGHNADPNMVAGQQAHQGQAVNMDQNKFRHAAQDTDHIMQHLDGIMNKPRDQMTDEELQFYYFRLHDYDQNNKLDGTELTKAITHFHEEEDNPDTMTQTRAFSDAEIENIVDIILEQDDLNGDGYVEYMEFAQAQKRANEEPDNAGQ